MNGYGLALLGVVVLILLRTVARGEMSSWTFCLLVLCLVLAFSLVDPQSYEFLLAAIKHLANEFVRLFC